MQINKITSEKIPDEFNVIIEIPMNDNPVKYEFDKEKNKSIVSELPIGMWTDKFKEMTEDWLVDKKVKSVQNYSTPNHVYFVITESEDGFSCNLKNMKLHSYLYTSNMVLFN